MDRFEVRAEEDWSREGGSRWEGALPRDCSGMVSVYIWMYSIYIYGQYSTGNTL